VASNQAACSRRVIHCVVSGYDNGEWSDKQIRIEVEEEGSGAFGYLSVVDNATNDAYFVRGIKRLAFSDR
jgi:hypothetical protein